MEKEKLWFSGGIHPTGGEDKLLTEGKQIIRYVPESVCVNMKHGLGPACSCMVKPGDTVVQGQVIGEAGHFLSAVLHAPVSGTVTMADDTVCVIKTDSCTLFDGQEIYNQEWADISAYSREILVKKIKDGGLAGMGGAGFPTHVKYQTKASITHVLINAAECEPFLTCDEHVMLEQGMALLNGVQILKKAAGAENAIICMEDNKSHCKAHLEDLLKACKKETEIAVMLLPTKYPQGGEKQLIAAAVGREVPAGGLPADAGVIVSNVQTAKAAADSVLGDWPLTSRCITITGDVDNPGNYLVPLGTDIGELVKAAGDVSSTENKVILGGPMTGRCIGENLNAAKLSAQIKETVTKVSGGLVVLAGTHPVESACIRCGGCAEVCPAGIIPYKIDAAMRGDNVELCQHLYAAECIGCGCCSFICPAKRELTHYVTAARDAVRMKLREEANRE